MDTLSVNARRPRRSVVVAGAAVVVAVAAVALFWFQPQKLWIDERTAERLPTSVDRSGGSDAADEPAEVARGEFVSRDHHTAGTVRLLAFADGRRIARIEGLDTSNGPDLFVYASTNQATGPEEAFDDDYVNLGRLKGNQGDQNYDVPAGFDIDRFSTVVIWCDRFDAAFGAADLALSA